MVRIILQSLLVALIRFTAAGIALMALIELAYCVVGETDRHVWLSESYGLVPPELTPRPVNWVGLLKGRAAASLPVMFVSLLGVLLIGVAWGTLGARLRRFRAASLLGAPFGVFACVPGFWFVILIAIYSYFQWKRPGFANELVVDRGPDILGWWHACVIALPLMAAGVAWQIRAVSSVLEKEAARPYLRGLFIAGYSDEDIFYRNAFRRALPSLLALSDRTVSFLAGSLICLEFAFRYPGIGSLLIESVKLGSYVGILVSALSMAAFVSLCVAISECAARLLKPGGIS